MTKTPKPGLHRRHFLAASAATAGVLAAPAYLRAQAAPVRIGLVHPVTGGLAYSGNQCRAGALLAIADINAAGGIRALGGAPLEAMLGDSQSKPETGAAETAKLIEGGAAGIVGGYASSITLATTQEAARTNTPHVVDVGVADTIVTRGLGNVFRFSPGYGTIAEYALDNLVKINDAAGKPAKSVMIIHEESAFGTGTAGLLSRKLPDMGFEVLDVIKHANPTRDFTNIALQIRARKPDILIPAQYYNEYVLLARTLRQQHIAVQGIYSVLGGAASSFKFVEEFPEAAAYIMDCNHWFNPLSEEARRRRAATEAQGLYFTYEVYLAYNAVAFMADAIERAGSTGKDAVIAAMAASTWEGHAMPYGPTRMEGGQNTGARPVNTQVLDGAIKVILGEFAEAVPVFPMPAA